jgi:hypothetical protein
MSHNSLENYLKTNYQLMKRGYQYSEIEQMIIYEKDFYVLLMMEESKG